MPLISKEGFELLSKLGLLKELVGNYPMCNVPFKLVNKKEGNGLL